ncbi:MAG TPA: SDR family oxidoreductase [Acidimicrobiales bacterium]|nr:SDR family oxidoreductase [Acidimicrobiales bacterium]
MISIDLSGSVGLVVGGGGGGIGTATAVALAEAGADVGAITNVAEHAADTEQRVRAVGRRAATVVADVTEEGALVDAIAAIGAGLGPVDRLVNVVGGALPDDWHRLSDYDMDAFDRLIARNLRYAVVACREVAHAIIADGRRGAMVNISSVAARGTPLLGGYGASKAALESFGRTMALEWGPHGIRVNAVAPGTIKTPRAGQSDLQGEASRSIPLGRRGEPTDIANAAIFLLSDLASYITGQTLVVDGGSTLGPPGEHPPAYVTNPAVLARFSPRPS